MTATRAATRVRRGTKTAKSGARHASSRARQVKQKTLVQRTARAGLCARGLIYLVLTVITVDIAAFGGTGKRASATGAIDELVRQPAGPFLVIVLAAGLAAYAGWRWLQASAGDEDSQGFGDVAKRIGLGAIGWAYAALCIRAVLAIAGRSSSRNPSRPPSASGASAPPRASKPATAGSEVGYRGWRTG